MACMAFPGVAATLLQLLLLAADCCAAGTQEAAGAGGAAARRRTAKMRLLETNRMILQRSTPWPGLLLPRLHFAASPHPLAQHWGAVHTQLPRPDHLQQYQPEPELLFELQPEFAPEAPGPGHALLPEAVSGEALPPGLPPGLPSPSGDQNKLELSLGPCVIQLYEPCSDGGGVVFYLFSSVDGRPAVLSANDPQLPAEFDADLPTKVLIHGFAGSVDFNFTSSVRQAYLLRGGFNVLVVDWGRLTPLPCYASSVINTWQVARCTAQLLARLGERVASLRPPRLHLVGFSLGAHIAAFTANELLARTGLALGRITGLDPALPAFASLSPSWKLDPGDAAFVDVVHTNAGVLGKIEPTGHADFYVNGGSLQPFCTGGDRNIPLCSHLLAPVYFSETILDETSHWGRPCSSVGHYAWGYCPSPSHDGDLAAYEGAFMGEGADSRVHGTFIVQTAADYPFALGPPQPISPPPARPLPPTVQQETIFVLLSRRKK